MTWHQAPFLRLLLPLLVGIIAAFYLPIPLLGQFSPVITCLLLPFGIYFAWKQKLSVPSVRMGAALMTVTLVFLGYSLCYWQDQRHYEQHIENKISIDKKQTYLARIAAPPKLKQTTLQAQVQLLALIDSNGVETSVEGKIMASFKLDTFSMQLTYGDGILLQANLKAIGAADNPHGFDAGAYYRLQNIYHQCYLGENQWAAMPALNGGFYLQKALWQWRQYLIAILARELGAYPNELAVASALILGDRQSLSADLKNAYADTGATHVLAVSGLHVGLISVGLALLLGLFRRKKNGTRKTMGEVLFLLLGIWFFALLTGASPSVMRAATMFSLITIADALDRRSSIYNTLAGSAFLLLCLQPTILWDIGFQLSYLAVLGIVYLHPLIYKKLYIANKLGDYIWNLTAVSLAAQIATLPISLFYFHQFPIYFWLSGLLVIPLATIIMFLGVLLLLLSGIPALASIVATMLYWALALMNAGVFMIQQLPGSVWDGFWLEAWEMWLCYAILILIIASIVTRKLKWITVASAFTLVLLASGLLKTISNTKQSKIFVYKVYKGTAIDFVSGRKAYTWVDSLHNNPRQLQYIHQNNLWSLGVLDNQVFTLQKDSVHTEDLYWTAKGFGQFTNTKIACLSPDFIAQQLAANQPLPIDYLLLTSNAKIKDLAQLELLFDYKTLVFDASNSPYRLALWRRQCLEEGIPFVDCSGSGQELE